MIHPHRGPVPHSAGEEGPDFEVPAGACDCHMHLFDTRVPFAPGPVLRHEDASLADYRLLQRRLRLRRHVIVQPSSYGTDNRVLVRGLVESRGAARGVAVVDPSVEAEELEALRACGVRGVRFNLVQSGATDESMLEQVARIIEPLGWHIQLHSPPGELIRLARRLTGLPVPVVLDHFARVRVDRSLADELGETVVRMLETGRTWLKLSGPYIASPDSRDHGDLAEFAKRWAAVRPDRLLWGTDWPHVTESTKPDDAAMMNSMNRWLTTEQVQQALVGNPAALYGFGEEPADREVRDGA